MTFKRLVSMPRFRGFHFAFSIFWTAILRISLVEGQSLIADSSFGNNGTLLFESYDLKTVRILENGTIMTAGWNIQPSDSLIWTFAFTPDGKPDSSYGGTGSIQFKGKLGWVGSFSAAFQEDRKLVTNSGGDILIVSRYKNGRPDSAFGENGKSLIQYTGEFGYHEPQKTFIGKENKIYVTTKVVFSGDIWEAVMALKLDGSIDSEYGTNGQFDFSSHSHTVISRMYEDMPFGDLILGGYDEWRTVHYFPYSGSIASYNLPYPDDSPITGIDKAEGSMFIMATSKVVVKRNQSGQRDISFGTNGRLYLDMLPKFISLINLATLPDGKILAVGKLGNQTALQRFLPNGQADFAFGDSSILSLEIPGDFSGLNKSIFSLPGGRVLLVTDKAIMQLKPYTISGKLNPMGGPRSKVMVFPNPSASGVFQVVFPESGEETVSYSVLAVEGKEIQKGTMTTRQPSVLDLGSFPPGLYQLKIQSQDRVLVLRLLKE